MGKIFCSEQLDRLTNIYPKFHCRWTTRQLAKVVFADIRLQTHDRQIMELAGISGGAKGGPAGARAPAVKPCAPAVPRQLSYSDSLTHSLLRLTS